MEYTRFIMFTSIAAGMLIGVLGTIAIIFRKVDMLMAVNTNNPEKDMYRFVVLCPLDEIPKRKYLIVEVKNNT